MDRLDSQGATRLLDIDETIDKPGLSMTSLRQQLTELRKQARLHDREALTVCLTLAISLAAPTRRN